jgi:sterol desaturase/sphingolipid hydroxylase (fatty acid hydroxylase superfamily)
MAVPSVDIYHYTARWRRLLSASVFPGTLVFMITVATTLIHAGYAVEIVVLALALSTATIALFLEWYHPHARLWSENHQDVPTDVLHMLLSEMLPPQIYNALCFAMLAAASAWIASLTGFGLWPETWSLPLQLALALVIGEFFYYWWHRLCHRVPLFWRLHATHHSAPRLYWLNAGRFHPLDNIVGYALQATPLLILGATPEVMGLFALFTAVHGIFQHANIDVKLGPLNYLFSMAELHRWHHSRNLEDANANYGGNLIVWDIVFGTRRMPKDREHQPQDVGLHGMSAFPKTYLGQLASPFTWTRLQAREEHQD